MVIHGWCSPKGWLRCTLWEPLAGGVFTLFDHNRFSQPHRFVQAIPNDVNRHPSTSPSLHCVGVSLHRRVNTTSFVDTKPNPQDSNHIPPHTKTTLHTRLQRRRRHKSSLKLYLRRWLSVQGLKNGVLKANMGY